MAIPTNIKTLLSGEVVEWARIEFKETWDAAASLKTICAFANDLDNWGGGYIVIGVEEDALSKQSSRCLRKLLRNQGNKLLLSTQLIDQTMLKSFEGTLLVSIDHLEMKERRLLFRYLIDMLVSRYFELECA